MKLLKGFGGNRRLVFNMGELETDGLLRYFQPQGKKMIIFPRLTSSKKYGYQGKKTRTI